MITIKNPTVSVVIPTYNRVGTLMKVLPTYLSQKFVCEVIVIDDCSTDDTYCQITNLLKTESKLRYCQNESNRGCCFSKNRGIGISKGDYVFIGEDDVELTRNFLTTLLAHMKTNNADIISGRRLWLTKDETKSAALLRHNKIKGSPFDRNLLITYCGIKLKNDVSLPLVDASMLIKKEVFKHVSYDENYGKNAWREETDFQLSACRLGYNLVYCPHVYCFHLYKAKNVGGNHAYSQFTYEYWVQKNNVYMAKKFWGFLKEKFNINYMFFIRFFWYRFSKLLVTNLVELKRKLTSNG